MIDPVSLQMLRDVVTIFGVIAGLTYYFLTVQNANKARKIQLTMRLNALYQSKDFSFDSLELLDMQWEDYDDFLRKYDSTVNHDNYSKRATCFNMFNEVGYLLNQKLIDIETVFDITGGHAPFLLWNKFKPIFLKQREHHKDPNRQKWYEYLITARAREVIG